IQSPRICFDHLIALSHDSMKDGLHPQSGENELRCAVANTWHNRLVPDSARPPDERITRTNIRGSFGPDTPPRASGLLGPVRLVPVE
ncbi:MAG: hypothetical protein V3W06_06535, partial [Acidimicrobiia bacterium]